VLSLQSPTRASARQLFFARLGGSEREVLKKNGQERANALMKTIDDHLPERHRQLRLLDFVQLKPLKGVPYHRDHLRRLIKAGLFPPPVALSDSRIAWIESEIDAWIIAKAAQRRPWVEGGPRMRQPPAQDREAKAARAAKKAKAADGAGKPEPQP
jgi:prophage regulatory protein